MKIDELKSKILQLAIQGKLVEQNQEDISASFLIKEIELEKENLIKEKKIKKENPFPGIEDADRPYKLPKGWEFIRLGDFIRFVGGNQPPKSTFKYEFQEGYIRLIQIRDYKSDSHITFIPYEKAKKFCSKDDIMIGRYGPPIFQILRGIEGAYNVALMKADPIGGIEKDYLYYLLKDSVLLKKLEFLASRTCGQDGIDMDTLKSYVVGLPPLEEQKRIVKKIEELFEIIDELNENKEAMLKNISCSRNKVLQLAIQGKLVEQYEDDEPVEILLKRIAEEKEQLIKEKKIKKEKPLPEITEEEKLFELPKGWEWCRLGDIGFTNIGLTYSPKDVADKGTPVLRSTNIQNDKIDLNDLVCVKSIVPENKMCQIGDILICARNGSKRLVGKCAIIKEEGMSFGAFMAIYRSKYSQYINLLLNSYLFRKQLNDVNTVTINQITQEMLRNTICPLPPLEEQKRIVAKVDEIMDYLDELEKTILEQDIM